MVVPEVQHLAAGQVLVHGHLGFAGVVEDAAEGGPVLVEHALERNAVAVRPHLAGTTQRVPQIAQLEPQVFDLALDEGGFVFRSSEYQLPGGAGLGERS